MQTQWRVGMSGATGLDYAGVRAWLDECGPSQRKHPGKRREMFLGIQAAERGTLDAWAEQRKQQDAARATT